MNNEPHKLDVLFQQYIDECQYIRRLRKATLKSYREVFANFSRTLPEVKTTTDLVPQLVMKFFRQHGEKKSRISTVYTYYNKLMVFFRWLETYDHVEKGSLTKRIIPPPSPHYNDSKALGKDHIARIQSAITMYRMDSTFLLKRDVLILSLFLYTGIRKGELLGIRIADIDWSTRNVHINGDTSKSKKGRNIPLNPTLYMHLKNYLDELRTKHLHCEYLILSGTSFLKFTEHGLKHWVKTYNERSGVSFHLHQFRHTFATTLALRNVDVSSIKALMGHASIAMTERYLRSITTESTRNHIDTLIF